MAQRYICASSFTMHILFLAFASANGLLLVLCKMLGHQRVIRHQILIDIILTFGLPVLFFGTFSGMATAMIAGIIVSIELWIAKQFVTT